MTSTPVVTVESRIMAVIVESNHPLSGLEVTEGIAKRFDISYSRQHIKRVINALVAEGRLEIYARAGKTDYYATPGQALDPWENKFATNVSSKNVFIRLSYNNLNYTPARLADHLINMKSSLLSEAVREALGKQLALLVLHGSVDKVMSDYNLSMVLDVRKEVQNLKSRLDTLSGIIGDVLDNPAIKNGTAGQTITDTDRDTLLEVLIGYIEQVSTNKRSNIKGDAA